ncbi:MAG: autotransporter domain-containing protein [Methylobacteriaceae bacterium]|nr:autotransporter domain-containing protein [Methylobacteriaceae bacterium]HPG02589.1 autotransporter domain-containing protein [Rhodoblastus sp.]
MITTSSHADRNVRLPLLTAASVAALLAASPAQAGCAPGNGGPRDYLCTGGIGATSFSDARTVALTGSNATGQIKVAPTVGGNIGFSMDASSSVKSTGYIEGGVELSTTNGNIDTTSPSGSGINGAISSDSSTALSARTTNGNINIKTGAGGTLTAGRYGAGLDAATTGAGSINLDLNAKVSGYGGVRTSAVDGATNIKAQADITGNYALLSSSNSGAIAITTSGSVLGGAVGVRAESNTGNISMNLGGEVMGSVGVFAQSAGDITINTVGKVTGGGAGIVANATGKGAVTVTTKGQISAYDGVVTSTEDGWNTLNIGSGGIKATHSGVIATATGTGSVKIQIHGDISSTNEFGSDTSYGVAAATKSGSIQIDLDAGKFVSGGTAGIFVQSQTGAATINNSGTITASGSGVGVLIDVNDGSATLNNSGTIKVDAGQVAIGVASGDALIKNTGIIDGAIVSNGIATVNNSGTWNNAGGSYIQNLNNTGALSLGAAGAGTGVLTVTGDASFGPGSYYNARITATSNDVILIEGKATITGGLVNITSDQDVNYTRGSRYILMQALGGVTGQFDGVISDMSKFTGLLTYDENNVYMTVLLRDFRSYALTRNQWSVANAIYWSTARLGSGLGGQLMLALNQSADSSIAGALTQLSGDGVVTGAANAALQTGHLFTSVLDDQQSLWRDSQPRDRIARRIEPFAYAPTRVEGNKWPVSRQNYAPPPVRRDDGLQRWRVWGSGFGGRSNLRGDAVAGSADQKLSSYGGALGVDYQMGSNMLFGIALGGSSSAFNAGNAQGSASGIHVGAYTGFRVKGFYGTASVAYSNFANKTTRSVGAIGAVAGEQETGSFSSEEIRTRLEIGRRIASENFAVTPFTAIEIAHLHTKPFIEQAAGGVGMFALSFNGQGIASTPTFIGLKAEARLDLGGAILTPWVSLAWRHEWSTNRTQTATLNALPGASFVIIGARPARDAAQVKGGVNLAITQQVAIFATFEGEFGTKNPVYSGRGGMKVAW